LRPKAECGNVRRLTAQQADFVQVSSFARRVNAAARDTFPVLFRDSAYPRLFSLNTLRHQMADGQTPVANGQDPMGNTRAGHPGTDPAPYYLSSTPKPRRS
jgi:hypothetical protein